jgi:hypothetical protein
MLTKKNSLFGGGPEASAGGLPLFNGSMSSSNLNINHGGQSNMPLSQIDERRASSQIHDYPVRERGSILSNTNNGQ